MARTPPAALLALIDAGAGFDAEYADGLSNHRPMALLALAGLGADDAQLQRFARHYDARLRPAPPPVRWPAGDAWASHLGDRAAWPAYRDLFLHWLITEDASAVLRQVLPVLMRGCGGAAFHGLIRTAYAVQALHRRELADALAYWACCWLDLGPPMQGRRSDVHAVLRQLHAVPGQHRLIADAMQAAALQPGFNAAVAQLRVTPASLQTLATLAAHAYAATRNFAVLHLVTSAHALRTLLPYLDDALPALQTHWRAYAAAVCAAGLRDGVAPTPLPWPEIVRAALVSDDDHVIKLVHSCREQEAAYGAGGPWQAAATRAVAFERA